MIKIKIFTAAFLVFLLTSCSNRVFGIKKEDFMNRVSVKDYAFLNDVDYLKNSIKEINRLGDGSSYYMSFVYKNNDMRLFSNKLLYQEVQNNNPLYKEKAIEQLLKQLLQERDYVKAELYALDYIENNDDNNPLVKKLLIESIYWQKKDSQVVPYINNLDRSLYSDYTNYELDLLKCVSSARLDNYNWADQYRALFFNQPLSPILKRAYSFLEVYPEYKEPFSKDEITYFEAIALASGGNYIRAQKILRPLLNSKKWIFDTRQSIKNVSKIIKESGYITVNLMPFKKAINSAPSERYYDGLVSYSSLYFNKNVQRFSSAVSILENEIDNIPLGNSKDDAIYIYILSLSHTDTDKVLTKLNYLMDYISDQSYKEVIIDHVITALVQNKEWGLIEDAYEIVKKDDSVSNRSRVSWILSRIYYYGYIPTQDKHNEIEKLLEDITLRDNISYYSYISNALLKKESNLVLKDPPENITYSDDDKWIDGFVKFGLDEEAVKYAKQVKDLNYKVSVDVARLLDREMKHLQALRFLNSHNVPLNSESFPIYYPLPYKEKIVEVAGNYDFPYTMFSGLLRTESGFDPYVVSPAGAVGLAQLLPATAAEQATNIGLGSFDINDPNTNILLGGTYISWLISKYGSIAVSAMAYNAGPGNVWDWQRKWGDLPDELFIEASPFKETRDYVPKILRSAIYYGHREFNISPYDVVKQVFPEI